MMLEVIEIPDAGHINIATADIKKAYDLRLQGIDGIQLGKFGDYSELFNKADGKTADVYGRAADYLYQGMTSGN